MPYHLTRAAQEDLIRISVTGIENFGVSQARRYHDALFEVFDLLSANPKMARERLEFTKPCRIHRFHSHVIIYQIEGDDIRIIRVRHGREDWLSDPT
ncbi:type II toxin-antitoxin system RelE/ParE family toxin [Parasedimentitalea maritima]|uniref:Toxin n=1 Tax=Parasedimentitalea maritima TaxID=2578117 RepID=A0ABY2UPE5_9RHOB|nr:type II toxin-antitoxin system RelE/ParE family toxin [Zongyanglinia marina]TLP55485.1 type II toxin-antitoxin system RelE/ParE family toxin [Zongyanglinia marina]